MGEFGVIINEIRDDSPDLLALFGDVPTTSTASEVCVH